MTGALRLEFAEPSLDYLGRLSRLRWERAFAGAAGLAGRLEIRDARAIPVPGSAGSLIDAARRFPGSVAYPLDSSAEDDLGWRPPSVSTLRELEVLVPPREAPGEPRPIEPPADFPARFVPIRASGAPIAAPGFRVIRVRDRFGAREEILSRIPPGSRRVLDVGCGAGETAAEAARRMPGLRVEGIDRHAGLAPSARASLAAFHEGDAVKAMSRLRDAGERFDVLIFADSLEHLDDPLRALGIAAELGVPGALLVISAPNVAGASIVGDLVAGRFDPLGAGPEDVGHVSWLTRESLREAVERSGFTGFRADAIPHPAAETLIGRLRQAGLAVSEDLRAIQWVATARLPERGEARP